MASISGKADASLPSSAEPSSESRPYKYDVYLSFWGADTREGFISTLYHRLQERGITTFKDVKETTIEESRFAIEESRFAIVVLSQKYAAYTWCLEQLSKICEVMKDGPRILPVYYDVKPADVRKQRGSFEDALSKYEMSGRNESGKVQQWRDALTKVANLFGLDSRNYMDDIELINNIVEFVCSRVQPLVEIEKVQPMETDREGSDVSEETRQDMDEFREVHIDDEVSFVGVDGTGGLGNKNKVQLNQQQHLDTVQRSWTIINSSLLKGSFQDAFTKHEKSGRYKSEKVKQWRDALRKVASLSGWLAQDYNTETGVFEAIMKSVYTAVSGLCLREFLMVDASLLSRKFPCLIKEAWGGKEFFNLNREIALLSQFEHENIVQYYGTQKDGSKLYIFLELVTKGSLQKLYQTYHLTDLHASVYTRQILQGLKYLHDRKVIHRDGSLPELIK
ncbi:hypothetical protein ACLB2K_021298 [Fragaria x ananassa]